MRNFTVQNHGTAALTVNVVGEMGDVVFSAEVEPGGQMTPPTPSLTQAAQTFWEAATNEHERKHAERNP